MLCVDTEYAIYIHVPDCCVHGIKVEFLVVKQPQTRFHRIQMLFLEPKMFISGRKAINFACLQIITSYKCYWALRFPLDFFVLYAALVPTIAMRSQATHSQRSPAKEHRIYVCPMDKFIMSKENPFICIWKLIAWPR